MEKAKTTVVGSTDTGNRRSASWDESVDRRYRRSSASTVVSNCGEVVVGRYLAISQNAIDALLFGVAGNSALAPALGGLNLEGAEADKAGSVDKELFSGKPGSPDPSDPNAPVSMANTPALGSLSGVFTDPQFQVVTRALNQKKAAAADDAETAQAAKARELYASVDELRFGQAATSTEAPSNARTDSLGISNAADDDGKKSASADRASGPAKVEQAEADDRSHYNKQSTPKFKADVEQVKSWHEDAKGFLDSGRYDMAYKRAEQILNVDPYNIEARKLEEEVNRKKTEYGIEGYNQTRSYALWQSDKQWDRPVRKFGDSGGEVIADPPPASGIEGKLNQIIVPKIELREATLQEALEFLRMKGTQLDTSEPKGERRGLKDVVQLNLPKDAGAKPGDKGPADARITMSLSNIPLGAAYRYVAELAGLEMKAGPDAISLAPKAGGTAPASHFGKPVEGKPGFVTSPYAPDKGMIDLRGFPPGTEVKDPYTGKNFLVPDTADANLLPNLYLNAYSASQAGDKLLEENHPAEARQKYEQALKTLDQLSEQAANWNPTIVKFRREKIAQALAKAKVTETQAKVLEEKKQAEAEKAKPEPAQPKVAPDPLIPQPEVPVSANAFSTFSLNVTDVAFKLAAASLERGTLPEAGNMRSEEFINAFDYGDPEALPGNALAFTSERARYPFAQNRDILRFSVKTAAAGRAAGQPLNLVLLLDNSGSMERADRVRIVKEAMRVLTAQFHDGDKLSLITFARTPRLWADGVTGKEAAAQATTRATEITPQGGTDLDAALELGYQVAAKHFVPNGSNRVVLLTDGAANLGNVDPAALQKKVEAHRLQGIALDSFGVGWEGYNDDLLEQLTRHGDGRYGFINTPEEAATGFAAQLAGALRVAAADVKVQVEFNPKRVNTYRQIGYAKHQLTKEQFRDNTVDAAELGAAEAGNALYTVEVNPLGSGDLATVHVRYKVPGTTEYREQAWPVPFTGHALPLEQASPALRLATTASAFSEMLARNPYAGEVTSDRLLALLNGVPDKYAADPRPKKLEWMIRTAKSLSGR